MQKSKFRTVIGLVLLYAAILLNWQWIWGILFLIWVIPDLFSGITYFIEPIEKKENPVLYWIIVLSWLWMSAYMIAIPFFPQLNAQNQYFVQPVKNIGVYQDTSIKQVKYTSNDVVKKQNASTTISSDKNKVEGKPQKLKEVRDSLEYKTYHSKEIQYFVGIAAAMNVNDLDLETHTAELWNSFYENDISQVISNIVDERVYFIYSNTGKDGNFKATIAYRTKDIVDVYKGLEGIQIPPTRFAVFEQKGNDSESFIAETWTNIYESDLETSNGFNLEIYELDKDYKVKKSEIRIAIN